MKRICFLRLNAYPLFYEEMNRHFGGAEVRAVTFAKGLASRHACEVSFLTYAHGQREAIVDGVRIIPGPSEPNGIVEGTFPVQSSQHVHRNLESIVQSSGHDVYCCVGVNEDSAAVIAACRKYGRKSVLFVASDTDLSDKFYHGSKERGPYGEDGHACFSALQNADQVVLQTDAQNALLQARFLRRGDVIRNPIDLSVEGHGEPLVGPSRYVLWVGRADTIQKRPELCIEIAQSMPEVPFVMILNASVPDVYDRIAANTPMNVRVIERVPFSEVWRYYAHSYALLNTSAFEGFPNSFLQAGKYRIPVASLAVDPDYCLQRSRGGRCTYGDVPQLKDELMMWWHNPEGSKSVGAALRRYVERYHDSKVTVAHLYELIVRK